MHRNELKYTDAQIIKALAEGYGLSAVSLHFIGIGFSFTFEDANNHARYFLKIYPTSKTSDFKFLPQKDELALHGTILERFKTKFGFDKTSHIIPTKNHQFYFEKDHYLFVLCDYIAGRNPSYAPNELQADKFAQLLSDLHALPIKDFPELKITPFDVSNALSFKKYIHNQDGLPEACKNKIIENKEKLLEALDNLEKLNNHFKNQSPENVVTHGDPHHFNILQNKDHVYLIDWDSPEIAPRERDLWFYMDNSKFIAAYAKLNPSYQFNYDLCRYYQLQRFFEDLCLYLEEKCESPEQAQANQQSFLNHWGWKECLD